MSNNSLTDFERLEGLITSIPYHVKFIGESSSFYNLIKKMREIFSVLYDSEADVYENERALILRTEISKLQISPKTPDIEILRRCKLDNTQINTRTWGEQLTKRLSELNDLILEYNQKGSILNNEFSHVFSKLYNNTEQNKVKILCHPNERDVFTEVLSSFVDLKETDFITNITEYRDSQPLEALFCYGPLRLSGIVRKPESVILSPNYRRLIRFIWKGLSDETTFGCDPVDPSHNYLSLMPCNIHRVQEIDAAISEESEMPNDLIIHINPLPPINEVTCSLIELPNEQCQMYRPGSHILVFKPKISGPDQIKLCQINELRVGDYLITHDAKAGIGRSNLDPKYAPLAQIWKEALREIYFASPNICTQRMKAAGIELIDLYQAAQQWIEMGDTTITAPQKKSHFKALLNDVLGKDLIPYSEGKYGWQSAWLEIEKSRDTARKHGIMKRDLINEEIIKVLRNNLSKLSSITSKQIASENLGSHTDLTGKILFRKIISIHGNYKAPTEQLEKSIHLAIAEQYLNTERGLLS